MEKTLMILEPCAARAASVAHNPPLDRQASWHHCLTESYVDAEGGGDVDGDPTPLPLLPEASQAPSAMECD